MQKHVGGRSRLIALTAQLGALTFLATAFFTVYIPETKGYFNLGETGVYISSLLLPPVWAALAAGVGSALADVVLGYHIYAPATLLIKSAEGFIASLLVRRLSKLRLGKTGGTLILVAVPLPLAFLGAAFYTGSVELHTIGGTILTQLNAAFWILAALALTVYLGYTGLKGMSRPHLCVSFTAGGLVMVVGYFLYQQLILGVAAFVEIPFNIMQVLVGSSIALLVERGLRAVNVVKVT